MGKATPVGSPRRKMSAADVQTHGVEAVAAGGGAGAGAEARRARRVSTEAIGGEVGRATRWNFWIGLRVGAALVVVVLTALLAVMYRYKLKPLAFLSASGSSSKDTVELRDRIMSLETELNYIREELKLSRERGASIETALLEMKKMLEIREGVSVSGQPGGSVADEL